MVARTGTHCACRGHAQGLPKKGTWVVGGAQGHGEGRGGATGEGTTSEGGGREGASRRGAGPGTRRATAGRGGGESPGDAREEERGCAGREEESERERGRAHLGDPNLAITVTESPRAQRGREGVAAREN
jgi:hypothetical protein